MKSPTTQGEAAVFDDRRVTTGNAQTDAILGGGIPANSITILMGQPGTGKTVLAEQILFENADEARPVLYLTTLSEPLSKVITYLQRFDFYDASKLGTSVIYDDIGHALVEHGIAAVVTRVRDAIEQIQPKVIVIDSFKAIHELAGSIAEMRRLVFDMAGLLAAYDVTTLLVGEYIGEHVATYPEFAVADAIVELARRTTGRRDERFLRVLKLRGSGFQEGSHAFRIGKAGLSVFPRLVSPEVPPDYRPLRERVTTGVENLDPLLDGGFWAGSSTLVGGGAGSGKTTFGLSFALEGVRKGEPSLYVNFQENPVQLARSLHALGADGAEHDQGLHLYYASPVELEIDSIVVEMFDTIRRHGVRRVVIDALGDLAAAASDRERLHDYLYAMIQHFVVRRVTCVMTYERYDLAPGFGATDWLHFSSISDNIVELATQLEPRPRRILRVVKARATEHDLRPHEFQIHSAGLRLLGPVS
jgi:circadian clock protein KaiC